MRMDEGEGGLRCWLLKGGIDSLGISFNFSCISAQLKGFMRSNARDIMAIGIYVSFVKSS